MYSASGSPNITTRRTSHAPQLLARKFPKDRSIIYVAYVRRLPGLGEAGVSSIGSLLCTLYLVSMLLEQVKIC